MQRRQLLKRAAIQLFLHPPGGSGTAVSIIAACLNIASVSKNKWSSSSFLKKCYGSQAPKNKSYGLSKHPQVSKDLALFMHYYTHHHRPRARLHTLHHLHHLRYRHY